MMPLLTARLDDGNWHTVTFVQHGDTVTTYIDNKRVDDTNAPNYARVPEARSRYAVIPAQLRNSARWRNA